MKIYIAETRSGMRYTEEDDSAVFLTSKGAEEYVGHKAYVYAKNVTRWNKSHPETQDEIAERYKLDTWRIKEYEVGVGEKLQNETVFSIYQSNPDGSVDTATPESDISVGVGSWDGAAMLVDCDPNKDGPRIFVDKYAAGWNISIHRADQEPVVSVFLKPGPGMETLVEIRSYDVTDLTGGLPHKTLAEYATGFDYNEAEERSCASIQDAF